MFKRWFAMLLVLASGCFRACEEDPAPKSVSSAEPATTATVSRSEPIAGKLVGQARVTPGEIVSKGAPPAGSEVVLCVQQTDGKRRAASHCKMRLQAGEGGAITGARLHEAMEEYIGGAPYGTLYHQRVEGDELQRGARIGDDASDHAAHIAKDDEGRYLLFVELARG